VARRTLTNRQQQRRVLIHTTGSRALPSRPAARPPPRNRQLPSTPSPQRPPPNKQFDPYFNYRVTQFLTNEGFYNMWNW
jgi:hypothetical protein